MRRVRRLKLSMKQAWEIQKDLTNNTDKVMSYIDLANIAAKKMGWPPIRNSQSGYRELSKHYLIEYLNSNQKSKVES